MKITHFKSKIHNYAKKCKARLKPRYMQNMQIKTSYSESCYFKTDFHVI